MPPGDVGLAAQRCFHTASIALGSSEPIQGIVAGARRLAAKYVAKGGERTNATGASSSARRRNPAQDVPENAVLHLKRSRAVVLVISRGHRDDEIELGDDAN